ncbi:TPA: hypothetical protein DCX15_05815 [bacterium]|nr:hypothetical protein [bacterium]
MYTLPLLAVIGICILLAAFFSGSETGVVSINRLRLRHLSESGLPQAKILRGLLANPSKLLTVMLVGTNIAIVTASAVTTFLFEKYLLVSNLILSFLVLVFGEIIPKALFSQYPNTLTLSLAHPLKISYLTLLPLANLVGGISSLFVKPEGRTGLFMDRRGFHLLLKEGRADGVVDEGGFQMLGAVLDLPASKVKEVMTPRVDMVCIGEEAGIDEILNLLKKELCARIPVCKDSIDNITGILYAKDLLGLIGKDFLKNLIVAKDLAHPAYFVPEMMPLSKLLREFRRKSVHMAIVVDEYGGTAGLVTLEDLLEEIVGEIKDEYDFDEETPFKAVGEGVYLVNAKMHIARLNEELGLNLPEDGFETIAGFILERLGRIPVPDESIKLEGVRLIVLKADKKSILLVKLEVN